MPHNLSSANKSLGAAGGADAAAAGVVAGAAGEVAGAVAAAEAAAGLGAAVPGVRPETLSRCSPRRVTGPGLARPGLPVLFAPPRMLAIHP